MAKEVQFFPEDKFNYSKDGDSVEVQFILLSAPSMRHLKYYTPIKQDMTAAVFHMGEIAGRNKNDSSNVSKINDDERQDGNPEDESVGQQLLMSLFGWNGDLSKFFGNFKTLLSSGVALIDGETKLTEDTINHKMSLDDFERLVGVYIENFIMPSQMKATKNG